MEKVIGVGGIFFRARDPKALVAWYETHLGVSPPPADLQTPPWTTGEGITVFSPFAQDSDYTLITELPGESKSHIHQSRRA